MMHTARVLLSILLVSGVAACNLPAVPGTVDQEVAGQYATIAAVLTSTVLAESPVPQSTGQRTPTLPLEPAKTPQPTNLFVQPGEATATQSPPTSTSSMVEIPCNRAQAGIPIDITVPDDSRLYPGDTFSKTWRLVNGGSCTWDRSYALVWFSGDELGLVRIQPFDGIVSPGESVEVTVDMMAPEIPGMYQSNWKLRNGDGTLFGIGPNGNAPFWARIVVVPVDTPTVTVVPATITPAPPVFASGSVSLAANHAVDLDTGNLDQIGSNDLLLEVPSELALQLVPTNGARMGVYGAGQPRIEECQQMAISDAALDLSVVQPGAYLCYETSEGLPGRIFFTALDLAAQQVGLEFVTWAVP